MEYNRNFFANTSFTYTYPLSNIWMNPTTTLNYSQIEQIIEDDRHKSTQVKSKKDDWLGRLFRMYDREEREEVYDAKKQDLESDWKYEW